MMRLSGNEKGRFKPGLLLRYLLTYMGIFVLVVGLLLLLRREVLTVTRRNVLSSSQTRMQEGIERMTELTARMLSTTYLLQDHQDVQRLMSLSGSADAKSVPYILGTGKMVYYAKTLLGDDVLFTYLVFRNNDLLITNTTSGLSSPAHYGRLLSYGRLDGIAWYARLFAAAQDVSFWPEETVALNYLGNESSKRAVTCVVKLKDRITLIPMGALAFMLDKDDVVNMLMGEELRESASLFLYDGTGTLLLQQGQLQTVLPPGVAKSGDTVDVEGDPHILLTASGSSFDLNSQVMIPSRLIDQQVAQVLRLITLYIWYGLLAGLVLVLLYAARQYAQVTRLLTVSQQITDKEYGRMNEYRFIGDVLRDISGARDASAQRILYLENEQRSRLLENACLRGLYTHAERQRLRDILGNRLDCFRLILIAYEEGADGAAYEAEEYMAMRTKCVTLRTAANEIACILAVDPQGNEQEALAVTCAQVLSLFTSHNANASIGISPRGSHIAALHRCYLRAKHALSTEEGDAGQFGVRWAQDTALDPKTPFDLYTPQALYNLLIAGNEEGTLRIFGTIVNLPPLSGMAYMQAFSSLRLSVERAAEESGVAVELPPFISDEPYEAAIAQLQKAALLVTAAVQEKRKSGNIALKNAMLNYIQENYMDQNLSAITLSTKFHISEKYVFHFLKEQTGHALGEHIEEARLDAAEQFLRNTHLSNEEIARRTGFGTVKTFYRAFKRRHGTTPAIWREVP